MLSIWLALQFGVAALAARYQPPAPACTGTARSGDFTFPLANGFPSNPNMAEIYAQAHGTLPNGPLPKSISDTTATLFEVIATNEIFEVAFFSDLLNNMSSCVPGYRVGDPGIRGTIEFTHAMTWLTAIVAQEELHAIGANAVLSNAGRQPISPCSYKFPVDNFADAIVFIAEVTDLVLGVLQSVIYDTATDGDAVLAPLIGSIIGNEAEQEGFFRIFEVPHGTTNPTALPFLTAADGTFAYSALNQLVLVPGSCPNASAIAVPIFGALMVDTAPVTSATTSLEFSFYDNTESDVSTLSLVYINQQNVPVVQSISNPTYSAGVVSFSAPFNASSMNGLTIAALTDSAGPFTNASNVAASTKFGPGLIEVN